MENQKTEIDQAKAILKQYGYFVESLWNVNDVLFHDDCPNNITTDQAYDVLRRALENERIVEEIFSEIGNELTND